jgi:hypothetical protein
MESHVLTIFTVIFTAVVATFFILMAFQINQIVDIIRHIVGSFRPKNESPATSEESEDEENDGKRKASTSAEPVANPWWRTRHPWNTVRRRRKEKQSPYP